MRLSAFYHNPRRDDAQDDEGTVGALVIAILFVLLALASFAVDYSISLPSEPLPRPALQTPR